jgi:predicted amidohydrolase
MKYSIHPWSIIAGMIASILLAGNSICLCQDDSALTVKEIPPGINGRMELRVAGAVIPVSENIDSNIRAIKRAIDFAGKEHADILLTPEGSLSGYTPFFNPDKVITGLLEVTDYARAAKVGLALGVCIFEKDYERPFDQIRFYDQNGEFIGYHSKILKCSNIRHPSPGKEEVDLYETSELKLFKMKNIPVGGLVCNDLWATPDWTSMPDTHLSQQLAEKGARIIFHAANTGEHNDEWGEIYRQYHDNNLMIRARTGNIWIVTVDALPGNGKKALHTSGVVDPKGKWALRAEDLGEQFFVFTIGNL